jgi:hypothetical protein
MVRVWAVMDGWRAETGRNRREEGHVRGQGQVGGRSEDER